MKTFKFTISGKPYEVEVQNIEGNIATVNVNGTEYQVEMEEQRRSECITRIVELQNISRVIAIPEK